VKFPVNQTACDRSATMITVPINIQNLAKKVMEHILDCDYVEYDVHPLIYFMGTWDDYKNNIITDDEVEYRYH